MKYLVSTLLLLIPAHLIAGTAPADKLKAGKELAFERSKGNCLACHAIEDGEMPGNIGPPLQAIQSKFNSKSLLRRQIWDATELNPETSMPPFGKNKIITEQEIDLITDYIWSLP